MTQTRNHQNDTQNKVSKINKMTPTINYQNDTNKNARGWPRARRAQGLRLKRRCGTLSACDHNITRCIGSKTIDLLLSLFPGMVLWSRWWINTTVTVHYNVFLCSKVILACFHYWASSGWGINRKQYNTTVKTIINNLWT